MCGAEMAPGGRGSRDTDETLTELRTAPTDGRDRQPVARLMCMTGTLKYFN